ncbi:MAG: ECF-type sigma factor, partial [Planctomycetota bacterium]
ITLSATALVHEVFLRLKGDDGPKWQHQRHFFGVAAEAMRRILIDRARKRKALKRGGDYSRILLDPNEIIDHGVLTEDEQLLRTDALIESFTRSHPTEAELVKLRLYAGLSLEQAAEALGISLRSAQRYWKFAKAWLCRASQTP